MTKTGMWLLLARSQWHVTLGTTTPNTNSKSFGKHGGDALRCKNLEVYYNTKMSTNVKECIVPFNKEKYFCAEVGTSF